MMLYRYLSFIMKSISKLVTYIKVNFTCTPQACFDLIFQLMKICYGHFHISSFMSIAVNAFCHTLIPYCYQNPLIITCKYTLHMNKYYKNK